MDCPTAKEATTLGFLCRAHAQSGFGEGTRRMQCDHKWGFCDIRLTFVFALKTSRSFHRSCSTSGSPNGIKEFEQLPQFYSAESSALPSITPQPEQASHPWPAE
jgi:hypothetical protein